MQQLTPGCPYELSMLKHLSRQEKCPAAGMPEEQRQLCELQLHSTTCPVQVTSLFRKDARRKLLTGTQVLACVCKGVHGRPARAWQARTAGVLSCRTLPCTSKRTEDHEVGLPGPCGHAVGRHGNVYTAQLGIDLHAQIGCVLQPATQLAGVANTRIIADKALAGNADEAVCCPLDLLQAHSSTHETLGMRRWCLPC